MRELAPEMGGNEVRSLDDHGSDKTPSWREALERVGENSTVGLERTMSMNDRPAQSVESGCYPPLSVVLATFVEGAYRC